MRPHAFDRDQEAASRSRRSRRLHGSAVAPAGELEVYDDGERLAVVLIDSVILHQGFFPLALLVDAGQSFKHEPHILELGSVGNGKLGVEVKNFRSQVHINDCTLVVFFQGRAACHHGDEHQHSQKQGQHLFFHGFVNPPRTTLSLEIMRTKGTIILTHHIITRNCQNSNTFFWGIHKFHLFAQFQADFLCNIYINSCVKSDRSAPRSGFFPRKTVFSAAQRMNIRFSGQTICTFSTVRRYPQCCTAIRPQVLSPWSISAFPRL